MLLDEQRPRSPSEPPRPPRRRLAIGLAVALPLAVLSVPAASYVTALTAPGSTDWQATSVEWVRDHGGGPLVDTVENWWYAHNRPTGAAPAPETLPTDTPAAAPPAPRGPTPAAHPLTLPLPAGQTPLAHEAEWVPDPDGAATSALYSAYFRPDAAYPSQIVGVAWMNQDLASTHLFAGTEEPVAGTTPGAAQVPHDLRNRLVAVFNSGWKMADSRGGFYTAGKSLVPLQDGAASLVIDNSGRVTFGRWNRDVRLGRGVAAVRQNLDLVVDNGWPVDGLADNAAGAWGSPRNQFQYTWRSGLGTDRSGNLIYVAGDQLTLAALADAMTAAGVQRGMELDIHPKTVTFTIIRPTPSGTGLDAIKLLPAMVKPANRYLSPDHRDFLAVTLRTAP